MPDINAAYSWAVNTCNDPNVRYSQSYRNQRTINGLTYYDCSSFIWYALKAGGWDVVKLHNGESWPITTSDEESFLQRAGFTRVTDGSRKPGDVGWRSGHTEMVYNTAGVCMGAHGQNGIAGVNQVSIGSSGGNTSYVATFTHYWRYDGGATGSASSSGNTASQSVGSGLQLNIDWEKFNPYVLIMHRDSKDLNYSKLKDNKVVGAVVEAGYYYTSSHSKVNKFDNQNLETQTAKLEKQNIPYGQWMYARARSVAEAKSEMYWFSFPVRRHPPKLGVWLQLDLGSSKSTNDKIMEEYYDKLYRLGFKSRMGIICSKNVIEKKISWSKWQEKFYLLLIDHVKSVDEIEKLLDPEFFDTDGKSGPVYSGATVALNNGAASTSNATSAQSNINFNSTGRVVRCKFTAYYPANNALEGGMYDSYGNRLDPDANPPTCAGPKSLRGKTMKITKIDGSEYQNLVGKVYKVTDTGGAIKILTDGTYRIDLLMHSNAECNKFGIRWGYIELGGAY